MPHIFHGGHRFGKRLSLCGDADYMSSGKVAYCDPHGRARTTIHNTVIDILPLAIPWE
jgi:hypothetical protein